MHRAATEYSRLLIYDDKVHKLHLLMPTPLLDLESLLNFLRRLCHPRGLSADNAAVCFSPSGHAFKVPSGLTYEEMEQINFCTKYQNLFFFTPGAFWDLCWHMKTFPTYSSRMSRVAGTKSPMVTNSDLLDVLGETNAIATAGKRVREILLTLHICK